MTARVHGTQGRQPRADPQSTNGNGGNGDNCCHAPVDTIVQASASRLVDLDTTDTTEFPDGIVVWVRSVEDFFVLNRTTALTADGITVADPLVGGGQWLRRNVPSERWLRQATWFIDSAAGDDENAGDVAGSPLATHAELERRAFGHGAQIDQDVTVTIAAAGLPVEDAIGIDVQLADAEITYVGTATTVRSGTLTGATGTTPIFQQFQEIEDAVGGDWSGDVGERIRITDAADATAWIAATTGADSARTSTFLQVDFSDPFSSPVFSPSAGNAYVVETLPEVYLGVVLVGGSGRGGGTGRVVFDCLLFGDNVAVHTPGPLNRVTFTRSFLLGPELSTGNLVCAACRVSEVTVDDCTVAFAACLFAPDAIGAETATPTHVLLNSTAFYGSLCLSQNAPLVGAGVSILEGGSASDQSTLEFVNTGVAAGATFDSGADGIELAESCNAKFRAVWFGNSNEEYGLDVRGRAWYFFQDEGGDAQPTVTGDDGDTIIGSIEKDYADLPFFNASNGAQLVEFSD